jgi:hypothetical protein
MMRQMATRERRPAVRVHRSNRWIVVVVTVWGLVVVAGLYSLWRFGATPGRSDAPPPSWPQASQVARDGRPTLLLFAHPMCPCTWATLSELERLVANLGDRVDIHVLFIAPQTTDAAWQNSELRSKASSIPGATVHLDEDRRETRLFHAQTSGCCLLYDGSGQLLFRGGITAARGHEGSSVGSRAILALIFNEATPAPATPVFGCPLFEATTDPDSPILPPN